MQIQDFYNNIDKKIRITGITNNSKDVQQGYIFVCIKGTKSDGHKYIGEAIKNGCAFIVATKKIHFPSIKVSDTKSEYIRLCQIFYGYKPDIYTVGVTGTDGKTTTSYILHNILNFDESSSYLGTNGIKYHNNNLNNDLTTPSPNVLYKTYQDLVKNKVKSLVMEVSSEGIIDSRTKDFSFNGAIFTNISHEHLNSHKNIMEYFKTKAKLFSSLDKNALTVVNYDDPYGKYIKHYTKAKVVSFGLNNGTYQAKNIIIYKDKTIFDLYYNNHFLKCFKTNLFGIYNVYNTLAAITYAYEFGIPLDIIEKGIKDMDKVTGRFEIYEKNGITGIIDFAHTPNAIYQLLTNLGHISHKKLILVIGAQGGKDRTKRSLMGKIACLFSTTVIFTSEDPKNESIFNILSDLTSDLDLFDYYITLDRKEAIKLACSLAKKDDIILITGKGMEKTETIGKYTFKHNDYEVLKEALGQS